MRKQGFFYSSVLLILSAVITKIIGAIFRIPLANMLGGAGMGYFSYAYGIFMPFYAVLMTGLPTASAKIIAENSALERFGNVKKIKNVTLGFFALTGLGFTVIMIVAAFPLCGGLTGNPAAIPAVIAMAPSVFFGCVTSVYRGYYEGLRNMYPTAVSQIIEALVKLIAGLSLCSLILKAASDNPAGFLSFIEKFGVSGVSAEEAVLPCAAAAAVLGISLSGAAGAVFLIIRSGFKDNLPAPDRTESIDGTFSVVKEISKTAWPIAAGALITTLTSVIDIATIIPGVQRAVKSAPEAFSDYLSDGVSFFSLPNFIFGSFMGLAVTVFNLIPSFTNMFGKGVLPSLAEAYAEKDMPLVRRTAESVLFSTGFIAVPAGIGISALSRDIMRFLFPSRPLEIEICALPLSILGIAVIFLSISAMAFSALQAAGKAGAPVLIMLAGVAVKLAGNFLLIPIPELHAAGAALSTLFCYLLIFLLSMRSFAQVTGVPRNVISSLLLKMTYCGMICAAAALLASHMLKSYIDSDLTALPSIAIGMIFYIISAHLTGILTKNTFKTLIS